MKLNIVDVHGDKMVFWLRLIIRVKVKMESPVSCIFNINIMLV